MPRGRARSRRRRPARSLLPRRDRASGRRRRPAPPLRGPLAPERRRGWRDHLRLAADSVVVAVEVVRIGLRHVPQHLEVSIGNVRAVEVGRRWRNALVRVRRRAVRAGRWRWRWFRRRSAAEPQDRVKLDRVRGYAGLPVEEVEEGDARHDGVAAKLHRVPRLAHLTASSRRRPRRACGRGRFGDHVRRTGSDAPSFLLSHPTIVQTA